MEQTTHKSIVVEKIAELIKKAPSDWAEQIAEKMGKCTGSIYYYASGKRGNKKGYPLEVLKHLNQIVIEKEKETIREINKVAV